MLIVVGKEEHRLSYPKLLTGGLVKIRGSKNDINHIESCFNTTSWDNGHADIVEEMTVQARSGA